MPLTEVSGTGFAKLVASLTEKGYVQVAISHSVRQEVQEKFLEHLG
jgi:hypothetical protein